MGRVKVNSVRTVGGVAVKKAGGKPGSKPGQHGDGTYICSVFCFASLAKP